MEMLDSQVSSAKIPLGRLASPDLYYVLSGNDFTLDINDPKAPKLFCLGSNPQKQEALAPVLSLYIDRLNNLINKKGKYRSAMICDEFATVRASSVITTMATARSNGIVPILAVQDFSQLKSHYSHNEAETILNIPGNLICGQASGDTARWVSQRFPKTMQQRTTVSVNNSYTSLSKSEHLDTAISPATIAGLSSGEFVGITEDDPDMPIELKAFHARIINDHKALKKEKAGWVHLPVIRQVNAAVVEQISAGSKTRCRKSSVAKWKGSWKTRFSAG